MDSPCHFPGQPGIRIYGNDLMFLKYLKYQKAGVKEYRIVDVKNKIIQVNLFTGDGAFARIYSEGDTAPVSLFPGFAIELRSLFAV